jgi:hypothetical protein
VPGLTTKVLNERLSKARALSIAGEADVSGARPPRGVFTSRSSGDRGQILDQIEALQRERDASSLGRRRKKNRARAKTVRPVRWLGRGKAAGAVVGTSVDWPQPVFDLPERRGPDLAFERSNRRNQVECTALESRIS